MVKTCCVYRCPTTSRNQNKLDRRIILHSFPKRERSPARHRKWLARINLKDFVPTSYSAVCSEHFVDEDYTHSSCLQSQLMPYGSRMRAILKGNAVPSLRLRGPPDETLKPPRRSKYLDIKARSELLQEIPRPPELSGMSPLQYPPLVIPPAWPVAQALLPSPSPVMMQEERDTQCDMGIETLVHAQQAKATLNVEGPSHETVSSDVVSLRKMFPARRLSLPHFGLPT